MKDHSYIDENGRETLVADLPTAIILELLADGVAIINPDGPEETAEAVMERLRIEIVARGLT